VKYLIVFIFSIQLCFGQKADSTKAFRYALGAEIVMYSTTMYALNDLWYKDYPRSSFHWYNDNANWLQMDKIGHATTAYSVGLQGRDLFLWVGVPEKKALWFGGLYGSFFLTTIEILDGFSEEWGASWGDLIANTSGTALFIGQELLFKEQKVQLKYSFAPTDYAKQNPDLLGQNFLQQSIKDYNGQVYWLSFNINSIKKTKLPDWINFAIGYGADGMLNGNPNEEDSKREYYMSFDIDLRKIKTNSSFLDKTLKILSFVKVPMPALKLSDNKVEFYPIHYGQ